MNVCSWNGLWKASLKYPQLTKWKLVIADMDLHWEMRVIGFIDWDREYYLEIVGSSKIEIKVTVKIFISAKRWTGVLVFAPRTVWMTLEAASQDLTGSRGPHCRQTSASSSRLLSWPEIEIITRANPTDAHHAGPRTYCLPFCTASSQSAKDERREGGTRARAYLLSHGTASISSCTCPDMSTAEKLEKKTFVLFLFCWVVGLPCMDVPYVGIDGCDQWAHNGVRDKPAAGAITSCTCAAAAGAAMLPAFLLASSRQPTIGSLLEASAVSYGWEEGGLQW